MWGGWGARRPPMISPVLMCAILTIERVFVHPMEASRQEEIARFAHSVADGMNSSSGYEPVEHECVRVGSGVSERELPLRIVAAGPGHGSLLLVQRDCVALAYVIHQESRRVGGAIENDSPPAQRVGQKRRPCCPAVGQRVDVPNASQGRMRGEISVALPSIIRVLERPDEECSDENGARDERCYL